MKPQDDHLESVSIAAAMPASSNNGVEHQKSDVKTRILLALDRVRPYLRVDSGNVELVSFDETTGIVEVRLLGACEHCSMSMMTLRAGIERAIMHEAPEVVRVESVSVIQK